MDTASPGQGFIGGGEWQGQDKFLTKKCEPTEQIGFQRHHAEVGEGQLNQEFNKNNNNNVLPVY